MSAEGIPNIYILSLYDKTKFLLQRFDIILSNIGLLHDNEIRSSYILIHERFVTFEETTNL